MSAFVTLFFSKYHFCAVLFWGLNTCLRNSKVSVTHKNALELHFSVKKVQSHFSTRKVQLIRVAHFFELQLHFSEVTET